MNDSFLSHMYLKVKVHFNAEKHLLTLMMELRNKKNT